MRKLLCFAVVLVPACKGGGLGVPGDASVGARPADCPPSEPVEARSCPREGLLCEYGEDVNPLCNSLWLCSGGIWTFPVLIGDRPKCPTVVPTPGPNPSDCPADRAAVPDGQACTGSSTCTYGGSTCRCGVFCPSFPIEMPPCDADAGVTTNCCDHSKIAWHCFDGPAWCERPRPSLGTACTMEGQTCAVSPAAECGQSDLRCTMGTWQFAGGTCPISTAHAKRDIDYLDEDDAETLRRQLNEIRLARYRYRDGDDARHLGFVIEDLPRDSPAVMPSRERVDLYGYVSMAVATLQRQEREIAALKAEVARLQRRRKR
jgi:hypothetical protein